MSHDDELQEGPFALLKEGELLVVGAVVEAALAILALCLIWLADIKVIWGIGVQSTAIGVFGAVFLFGCNWTLYRFADAGKGRIALELQRFRELVARPLSENLSIPNAIALSILAGLCEELFFRGALQPLIGVVLSGAAFALLHFGPKIKDWRIIPVIYLLVSLFFAGIYCFAHSLWAAITAHAVYDAIVLMELRFRAKN